MYSGICLHLSVRPCACVRVCNHFLWTKYFEKLQMEFDKILWRGGVWPRDKSITCSKLIPPSPGSKDRRGLKQKLQRCHKGQSFPSPTEKAPAYTTACCYHTSCEYHHHHHHHHHHYHKHQQRTHCSILVVKHLHNLRQQLWQHQTLRTKSILTSESSSIQMHTTSVNDVNNTFYPRDAMLARSLQQQRVCQSVQTSVCHTRYCAKTVHFRHKVTMGR